MEVIFSGTIVQNLVNAGTLPVLTGVEKHIK